METTRKWIAVAGLGLVLLGCGGHESQTTQALTPELVQDVYVWGLPIVAMYRYYDLMGPNVGGLNRLAHNRKPSEPGQFSGGPNRDGLYSFGWFDLNDEPIVVSLPDFGERYFVWQMTDMYAHNFHNIGNYLREGPTDEYRSGYTFAMVGPDWLGTLTDRRWTWRQVFAWRRFPDRHRLDPTERRLYEQRWTTPVLPSNARHALKLAY